MRALHADAREEFVTRGFTVLRGAFSPEVAARCRAALWREMDADPDDPGTWVSPVEHLKRVFSDGPFAQALTPRLYGAFDDLLGEGRYHPLTGLGWWPVAFPGFDAPPWQPPESGWHIDGIQFHHHLSSPDQALLPLFLFSEIEPGDGGTAVAVGSLRHTARILAESEPDGLDVHTLGQRVRACPRGEVVELTGAPGDVALLHPFMLHARSPNTGSRVRFVCNPCVRYREPMRLTPGAGPPLSAVEQAIALALAQQ